MIPWFAAGAICLLLVSVMALASAYDNRGFGYNGKRQYDRAIQNYNQAIQLNPQFPKAYSNRSEAKRKRGDIEGADADLAKPRRIDPNIGT
jgi:tetratricopeptide (TPR) repeat protein